MAPPARSSEWEFPKLRYSVNFEDDRRYMRDVGPDTEFFDVKFYPYSPVGSNPVFAAVSKRHIFICRLCQTKDKETDPCEIIRIIRDDDAGALNCSCTWTKDPETERALLCVSGRDAKVKVYNIHDGQAFTSFVGHGGEINDLATSPANPHLIASASDDTTVRIWSLNPVHKRQPCVGLLAGEGHSWNLLSVAFHDSGRYILSAGHDQVINLWTLPDFPEEHMDTPSVVHYPHFSTSEIHTGLIDCVAFYGDMILSRACHEDVIVLWRIEGFCSDDAPPSPEHAPSNQDTTKLTRSAFAGPSAPPYTRLLQLYTPGCGPQFFMRFGLFHTAGHHPTLAFCNATAKVYFWDFACFAAYREFMAAHAKNKTAKSASHPKNKDQPVPRPPWLRLMASKRRAAGGGGGGGGGSTTRPANRLRDAVAHGLAGTVAGTAAAAADASSDRDSVRPTTGTNTPDPERATPAGQGGSGGGSGDTLNMMGSEYYNAETLEDWNSKFSLGDPHGHVKAHKTETIRGMPLVGRQVAWSPEGDWCVVVGSNSRVMVLQRWANGEMGHEGEV